MQLLDRLLLHYHDWYLISLHVLAIERYVDVVGVVQAGLTSTVSSTEPALRRAGLAFGHLFHRTANELDLCLSIHTSNGLEGGLLRAPSLRQN